MAKAKTKKETEQELNLDQILFKCRDHLRAARNSGSFFEKRDMMLTLVFLRFLGEKYEDGLESLKTKLISEGLDPEDENIRAAFFEDATFTGGSYNLPVEARWSTIINTPATGLNVALDTALVRIEDEIPELKGCFVKSTFTTRNLAPNDIKKVVDEVDKISHKKFGEEKDLIGHVYEYFLKEFAVNATKEEGEFYTPHDVVQLIATMIEPYDGTLFDPACGSGGMFVQSMKFVEEHQGNIYNIGIYGQEKNPTTWRLAKMNLAIRSMYGDLGKYAADTFTEDLHKDLKADFILANPPFNLEWDRDKVENDPRWRYGLAPKNNANYAWLQHMISKLSQNGKMACILANGSLSAGYEEGKIRQNLIENDLVDCIIAMPTNLFYTVTVPCSIWIISRNKKQKGKTLFINANNLGSMVTRRLRELSVDDVKEIADTYHDYQNGENYEDIKGFCYSATTDEIKNNDYVLTPGRYVGVEDNNEDSIPFEEKMKYITSELSTQFEDSHRLEEEIKKNLKAIGYDI